MKILSRRAFIGAGILGFLADSIYGRSPTPAEIEGPFYPVTPQKDQDFDLTRIKGRTGVARGRAIIIQGRVLDTEGKSLSGAKVDLWQANGAGRYRHPHESNRAPLDPNFQGWAILPSGKDGGFRFKTIYPGAYPADRNWTRPPHIHFKISKSGYREIITQMYFPGHELNDVDLLLRRKSKRERAHMTAVRLKKNPDVYEYNIVMEQYQQK